MKTSLAVKPFKHPNPKPKRLPERKAVTIIAGFKCPEGVVLCADTQETVGEISKRNVPKLRFEPADPPFGPDAADMAVAFCGAANNGAFIDKLVDRSWEAVQIATSLDEACLSIERTIKETYEEFGRIFQPGYCPEAELIYGVKMPEGTKMFYALGPLVNEKPERVSGGVGYYMADFLASRMYGNLLSIRQCIILAAYIIFQAKEHVVGCGGESHIAVLRNGGTSGMVEAEHVKTITELIQTSDQDIGKILMLHANLALTEEQFENKSTEILKSLLPLRRHTRNNLVKHEQFWNELIGSDLYDELGLPMPPTWPKPADSEERK
jgi:hypothetical protein